MRNVTLVWSLVVACSVVSCLSGGVEDDLGNSNGNAGSGGTGAASSGGSGGLGGSIDIPTGQGVGQACSNENPCRPGLACANALCEPSGSQAQNEPCLIGAECAANLRCTLGKCTPTGEGVAGESCEKDDDCVAGLRCALAGFSLQCAPEGTADLGAPCTSSNDCYSGLACEQATCKPNPIGVPVLPTSLWPGVECEEPPAEGEVVETRAFFEVPGATSPAGDPGDYFRLPFPSDIRVVGGKVDLGDFPSPGSGALGIDPVKPYIDAINGSESGWGTSPSVFFRFSVFMDFNSFRQATPDSPNPIQWVDITQGDLEYGRSQGLTWFASTGRTKYICGNWLGVRRPDGAPLIPGHTYAVFLRKELRGGDGTPVTRSPHFAAMLAASAPADAALAAAYAKFAPLRAYLTEQGIPETDIANATVITVGPTRDIMRELAAATLADNVPTASDWVKCGEGAVSPCSQAAEADGRACGADNAAFDEYQALVSLPIFQQGTAPYETTGGDVVTTAPVRHEDVCMSLTIPKGVEAPAQGWPLVVFGHGTGGSFRSHVTNPQVAAALSNVELINPPSAAPDAGADAAAPPTALHFAVLGYDQVQHGPRRGASEESPDNLFFNFLNPSVARGNPLQGAADVIAIGRFAAGLDLEAAQTTGDPIKIDPSAIVFFGHSQGSMHGSLALPYADVYKGAVLSGNGASIVHALLTKTNPVNIAQAVPFVLQDFDGNQALAGGENHPVLALIGQWIDPADPLNFARQIAWEPEMGQTPKHLFQTFGLGDTYSPPKTLEIFGIASQAAVALHHPSVTDSADFGLGGGSEQPGSVTGNRLIAEQAVTAGVRKYGPPDGKDGHFVVFDVPDANTDMLQFLAVSALSEVPTAGITAD